ncbi:MAG: acyloxyacyl hydrolase [Rhodospirillaceae bacterium]|nr:acyloxyacyl hydrolase [Rhodospirillaceae bacterium]
MTRATAQARPQRFPMLHIALATALAALALMTARPAASEDEFGFRESGPSYVTLGAGAFNIFPDFGDDKSVVFLGEYRHGGRLWIFGPMIGVTADTDGGINPYAGIYTDLALGNIVVTPFTGIGYWHEGNSKNLGGDFQFRNGIELAYEMDDESRVGLRLAHLSNAYIYDYNPGVEELMVTYSMPLGD